MTSIWEVLSKIDCNDHVEKKGQFSYLAWTWAWAMVKENYPDARYKILKDKYFHGSDTMEVRVEVTIDELSHTMWLPVLDFKNKPITDPNAFDINTARMRCLVKCLAMFGLGHYIYAGESAPAEQGLSGEEYEVFLSFLAAKDGLGLLKYMTELGDDKCSEAFNRAPKGQKVRFKDQVKEVQVAGLSIIDHYAIELEQKASRDDQPGVMELLAEISEDGSWLKGQVWGRIGEISKHEIKTILEKAA